MIHVNPAKKLKLVCFDLDGTMADTEPLHRRSKERLVRSLGYTAPIDYPDSVGKPGWYFWEPILTALGDPAVTVPMMEQRQLAGIIEIAGEEHLPPSEGLHTLLGELHRLGIEAAVCTSSRRFYAEGMLDLFALHASFSFVIGGDEVAHAKPAPDLYLAALAHYGVDGGEAVAIEDSAAGVTSAKAAGLFCVGYQNPTSGEQDLSHADWVVGSLAEIAFD